MVCDVETRNVKLLVADDSADVGPRLGALAAEVEGVDVVGVAVDGSTAIAYFERHRPNIIVLDQQMPELNGLQFVEHVRRYDEQCLVICMTVHDSLEYRLRLLSAGADHFLDKMADIDLMTEIIRAFVERRARDR